MDMRRGWLLLALMGLAMAQADPNLVDGKGNVIFGEGGNAISGNDNFVHAVDPTLYSADLQKLASEPTNAERFTVGAPSTAADRTTALQNLMNAVMSENFSPSSPSTDSGSGSLPPISAEHAAQTSTNNNLVGSEQAAAIIPATNLEAAPTGNPTVAPSVQTENPWVTTQASAATQAPSPFVPPPVVDVNPIPNLITSVPPTPTNNQKTGSATSTAQATLTLQTASASPQVQSAPVSIPVPALPLTPAPASPPVPTPTSSPASTAAAPSQIPIGQTLPSQASTSTPQPPKVSSPLSIFTPIPLRDGGVSHWSDNSWKKHHFFDKKHRGDKKEKEEKDAKPSNDSSLKPKNDSSSKPNSIPDSPAKNNTKPSSTDSPTKQDQATVHTLKSGFRAALLFVLFLAVMLL